MTSLKGAFRGIKIKNIIILFFAGIINAIGVTMFLAPVNLYDSGISGTSMLLWQITPEYLSLLIFLVILNVPLFLFGLKKKGIIFTIYSLLAVFVYSATSYIISYILPINVSSSPFAGTDLLLCAVFGGLISGTGSGLTLRFGGAIDGIEVLAAIFAKKIGITVGTYVMIYNLILYIIIGCVFRSWTLPLYSIVTYAVAIKAVDYIVEGLDKAKSVMIITEHEKKVCAALSKEFGHGITEIDAKGYYSQREKKMIFVVVNRFQIPLLQIIVAKADPDAFVSITEVSDVFGTNLKK